ncbi:hypothetical protein LH29_08040 [Draconibacterium sediminis]|uniref:DUF3823 domain-containing protein n=2 Tax=Draconibacterium sediminis TaxID=1544798 RepID=A0A0D8JHK1_9BACT|nr:hypothetical protein LH29_08040 [Draconibacterium sediminis]
MKMKYIKLFVLIVVSSAMIKCEYQDTDFGFDGSIKGMVKDNSGTPVYGDMSSNNLVVKLLGENDEQALEIRVNGDGTYQNLKMFPKKHEVWLEGPIVNSAHTTVDFSVDPEQVLDFTVTPLVSPKLNSASGSGTSISVSYDILPNDGNTIKKMEVYCSTVKYPTAAIGSRTNVYFTKKVTLTESSGSVVVDGLETGVHYYIRLGAQADGASSMNYSNQIEVDL